MRGRSIWAFSRVLVAVTIVVVPLSACATSGGAGFSAFGSNKLEVADIANIGAYSAESALSEARAHFRNGDYGHSAALYKRVVELSPKDPQGYVGLGASYDKLHRFDLSDRVYASLYKLTGGTVQYYNNLGYSYMLRGKLTLAMESFRKALDLDPDNVIIANNMQLLADASARA